jgi:hypothetical protein
MPSSPCTTHILPAVDECHVSEYFLWHSAKRLVAMLIGPIHGFVIVCHGLFRLQ